VPSKKQDIIEAFALLNKGAAIPWPMASSGKLRTIAAVFNMAAAPEDVIEYVRLLPSGSPQRATHCAKLLAIFWGIVQSTELPNVWDLFEVLVKAKVLPKPVLFRRLPSGPGSRRRARDAQAAIAASRTKSGPAQSAGERSGARRHPEVPSSRLAAPLVVEPFARQARHQARRQLYRSSGGLRDAIARLLQIAMPQPVSQLYMRILDGNPEGTDARMQGSYHSGSDGENSGLVWHADNASLRVGVFMKNIEYFFKDLRVFIKLKTGIQ